jgi:hypothetical protein
LGDFSFFYGSVLTLSSSGDILVETRRCVMWGSAIRPTTTQSVRIFLDGYGVGLRPWSSLDEVYGELHRLLERRKNDARFWPPLQRLLGELIQNAADASGSRALPAAGKEFLRSWDIEELIRDLKRALPDEGGKGDGAGSPLRRFFSRLPAPALSGFLLFGLTAAKCDDDEDDGDDADASADSDIDTDTDTDTDTDSDSDTDTDIDTDENCAPSFEECALDQSSILWTAINESTEIGEQYKLCLCSCFAALNESWTTGLTNLFETATAEETAAYLEAMVMCCETGQVDGAFPEDPAVLDHCGMIYKGVAFPQKRRVV